jgi:hypothetical protein
MFSGEMLEIEQNVTESSEILNRGKRFLVFPPSNSLSVMKYVAGFLGPIVSLHLDI